MHALELAGEDLERWCGGLSDEQINVRPGGVEPLAFHLRHIARSLDRLLTYAEGRNLTDEQLAALKTEMEPGAQRELVFEELRSALASSVSRVRALEAPILEQSRAVGKRDYLQRWRACLYMSPITHSDTWDKPSPRQKLWSPQRLEPSAQVIDNPRAGCDHRVLTRWYDSGEPRDLRP